MTQLDNGFPSREPIRALFANLLGVAVIVKKADVAAKSQYVWSTFVDDNDKLQVLCGFDLPLAVYAACALAALPKAMSEELLRSKKLEAQHLETVHEIINVLSSVYNVKGAPHVRLKQLAAQDTPTYKELLALLPQGKARLDQTIQIERYGSGTLTLLACAT